MTLLPYVCFAETLVLNTDGAPPHSRQDGTGFEDRIVTEAFRRINVQVQLVQLPSERALQNANDGIDDGNYVRIAGLDQLYPNLIMIPEAVSAFPFTAFTRDPNIQIASWEDLRGLQVASVTGWKLVERKLQNIVETKFLRDEEALFRFLDMGRTDVAIAGLYTGNEIIQRRGYKNITSVTPPLAQSIMYIYLHKRHVNLVPQLTHALQTMKRDGTMHRLVQEGLAGILP